MDEYQSLKKFFISDSKIKHMMYDMKPIDSSVALNEEALTAYSDKAYEDLLSIIAEIEFNLNNINISNISIFREIFEKLKQEWLTKIVNCGMNYEKLNSFYTTCVSDMKESLIECTKSECIGYTGRFPFQSLKMATTINEFLHILHSYIMNNNDIYKALNKQEEKELLNGEIVRLYGELTDMSKDLFVNMPLDLDCGETDIISFGDLNKIIMMIRDRGHALTIEIETSKDESKISYFIPKICNAKKVNNLPGIRKIDENSKVLDTAVGMFIVDNNDLSTELFKFISMVPTDDDIHVNYR